MRFRKPAASASSYSTDEMGGASSSNQSEIKESQSVAKLLTNEAEMVVAGVLVFPTDRSFSEQMQLAEQVRILRRKRLIELIARAIARDIRGQCVIGTAPNATDQPRNSQNRTG